MSGHNKWAQIKHKKAITDAKKGQLFSKLVKEIMVATRSGGVLIDTNSRLRAALERAKEAGLPKENMDRAMSRASGAEEGADLQEFLYEARLPGGVMVLIEGITDNKNRSTSEIKHIMALHDARLADPGSLIWNFEKIGVFNLKKDKNSSFSQETIEAFIIDSGALDFTDSGNSYIVETGFHERDEVKKRLESSGLHISNVRHDYKPKNPLAFPEEEKEKYEALFEALLTDEDIQEVYSNIKNSNP